MAAIPTKLNQYPIWTHLEIDILFIISSFWFIFKLITNINLSKCLIPPFFIFFALVDGDISNRVVHLIENYDYYEKYRDEK